MTEHYLFPRITGDAEREGDFLEVEDLAAGEWMPVRGSKIVCAILRCPTCSSTFTLVRADGSEGHHIADDGVVTPSVVCPTPGCRFHVHGKLLDWQSNSIVAR